MENIYKRKVNKSLILQYFMHGVLKKIKRK